MPDRYEIHAQYVPAVIYSASFTVIICYFLMQIKTDVWGMMLTLGFGGVSMTFALYQLAKHAGRFLGVVVQDWLFQEGLNLPTTRLLLDDNPTYTPDRKIEIITKIKRDFDIDLTNCTQDTEINRRRIHEAIGQVRKKLIKREMVQQRNIQYGFWRNLAGGSVIAICVSIVATILSKVTGLHTAFALSLIFLTIYMVVALISLMAVKVCAKYYALSLYDELLSM